MKLNPLPPQNQLLLKYEYDPDTGYLYYRRRITRKGNPYKNSGLMVGNITKSGYLATSFKGQHIQAHRLIWKMMTGDDPVIIDHKNGNKSDNRWKNLRSVDHYVNASNISRQKNNTSGTTGVARHKQNDTWRAYLMINRKQVSLGCFPCKTCASFVAKYCRELRTCMLVPDRPDSYARIKQLLNYEPCAKVFNALKEELVSIKPESLSHLAF